MSKVLSSRWEETGDIQIVKSLVTRHFELTGSHRAKWILENWRDTLSRFIKVFPHEFKRVMGVRRSQQPYIPNQRLTALAEVAPVPQMQHGQAQHG